MVFNALRASGQQLIDNESSLCNNSPSWRVVCSDIVIREIEFEILCRRHRDEIFRYARSLLANPADAQDAAQEVLLRLWNHLPTLNPFNLRAWALANNPLLLPGPNPPPHPLAQRPVSVEEGVAC